MSFSRRLIGGTGTLTYGWQSLGDSGTTTEDSLEDRNQHLGLVMNDNHIGIACISHNDFGASFNTIYVCSFDLDGNLNYERILEQSGSGDLNREPNPYQADSKPFVQDNPNDTDSLIIGTNYSNCTICHVTSTPSLAVAADNGVSGGASKIRLATLSNGDTWVSNTTSINPAFCLMDRSASTQYVGSVAEVTFSGTSWHQKLAVDTNDVLVVAGSESAPKATVHRANTSGTVITDKYFYVFGDTGDFARSADVCTDASDNIYVMYRSYDSSITTYRIHITMFSSALVEQWTAEFSSDLNVSNTSMTISPDGNHLYAMNSYNGLELAYLMIIDVSDGSKVAGYTIGISGADQLRGPMIACNSDSVCVAGVLYDSSVGYNVGPAILFLSQAAFESGNDWGDFTFTDSGITLTDKTPTVGEASIGGGGTSLTQVDQTSNIQLSTLDSAITHTYTEL